MMLQFNVDVATITRDHFGSREDKWEDFISRLVHKALATVESEQFSLVLHDEPMTSLHEVEAFAHSHGGKPATWAEWTLVIAQLIQDKGWEILPLLKHEMPISHLTTGPNGRWWEWSGAKHFIIRDPEWEGVFNPIMPSGIKVGLLLKVP